MSGMKECSWIPGLQEKSRLSIARASVVSEDEHLADHKAIFPRHRGLLVIECPGRGGR